MVPEWHYMPTSENPSEQGRRGAEPGNLGSLWFKGPIFGSAVQTNGHHNLKCAKPRNHRRLYNQNVRGSY